MTRAPSIHLFANISAGGKAPSRLRALRAQRRDKNLARNALDLTPAPTPRCAA